MTTLDYIVLVAYFLVMAGIGVWAMRRVKGQEDFFMGGRGFGKLLQTFAAFGAGTGSSDPVNTARTTFTSGMSGMWSIMSWLFVTPVYWIAGVWYRRMRHLTLGDWFVERYESRSLGAAYAVFGLIFYMVYTAMLFTATVKFAAPLMGTAVSIGGSQVPLEYVLVPVIASIVVIYGLAGGLTAAYWTDLIQGLFIILLSVLLLPFGLNALVEKYGDPATQGTMDGFKIMHERVPSEMFEIVGSARSSEFPLPMIAVVAVMLGVGAVVMPHFIATGGGSAKSEWDARMGIVIGNFLKRFCTIGWAITALIVLALMADSPVLREDPDKVWGVASMELLWPGLRGLMLACLLAALMGSADTYMLVCAALVVRNVYAPLAKGPISERRSLLLGRISGFAVIAGAVLFSWYLMDVFAQLQLTWIVPMLFAAPFWVGMYWRRATPAAAWCTIVVAALQFFVVPALAPVVLPAMRTDARFTATNQFVVVTMERQAAPADVSARQAAVMLWEQRHDASQAIADEAERARALEALGVRPASLAAGDTFAETMRSGGKAIFWSAGVHPVGGDGTSPVGANPQPVGAIKNVDDKTTLEVLRYESDAALEGSGNFKLDFLLYELCGMDLTTKSDAILKMLEFPPKIIMPFVVMIVVSLLTRKNDPAALDRYYAKMKTPVLTDPQRDAEALEQAYANPQEMEKKKLIPGSSLELQRPSRQDLLGFVFCFACCFAIVWFAMLIAGIGG